MASRSSASSSEDDHSPVFALKALELLEQCHRSLAIEAAGLLRGRQELRIPFPSAVPVAPLCELGKHRLTEGGVVDCSAVYTEHLEAADDRLSSRLAVAERVEVLRRFEDARSPKQELP